LELAAGESGLKASGNSGEAPKRGSCSLDSWRAIVSVEEGRGANKFSTHVPSQAPNHLVTTASGWFVGRKEQRKVIRDFEAVRLQPHTAVGIVFNQARMF
jgi:hypothetical protein